LERQFDYETVMLADEYISAREHEDTKQKILAGRLDILRARELANRALVNKDREIFQSTSQLQQLRQQYYLAKYELAGLETRLKLTSTIVSQKEGRLVEVLANSGDTVSDAQEVFSIALGNDDLLAVIYLPHTSQVKRVVPGTAVEISPVAYEKERYGYLRGIVTYASPYPLNAPSMRHSCW